MNTPLSRPAAVSPPAGAPPAIERPLLAHALLLGVAADALFRGGPAGIGVTVWIALVCLAMLALAQRDDRPVPPEARVWLAVAALFAGGVAWRESELLQFIDTVASLGALVLAAVALGRPAAGVLAPRPRDTLQAALAVVVSTAAGILPLALHVAFAPSDGRDGQERAWPRLRAALIALLLVLLFGSLLRGADPIFASLIALPSFEVDELLSHLLLVGFFTWVVGGWARGALRPRTVRVLPDRPPFTLSALDVTASLGALNLLFALFVLAQLGWLFGGESFLQARTGLTAAEYARRGFFQMIWVVGLVVPMLMLSRAALPPGQALARRHTLLSLPLIALLGLMVASAMGRMQLYAQYYGLTIDRLYAMVFMSWLFAVLVWLAVTVLRDRGRPFVAGVAVSALLTLAMLNLVSPDRIVARTNLARGMTAPAADRYRGDRAYLAELGGEASADAVRAALATAAAPPGTVARAAEDRDRCAAARRLLSRWGPGSRAALRAEAAAGWRRWNAGEVDAVRTVRANAQSLRALTHRGCGTRARGSQGRS